MTDTEKIVAIKEYLAFQSLTIGNDYECFRYDMINNPDSSVTCAVLKCHEVYMNAFRKFAAEVSQILDCG